MAIQKSRLGRGLGNLIAGGISHTAKPPAPAAKPAKQAPAKPKPQAAPAKGGKSTPAKASKPVAKPANTKPSAAAKKPAATAKKTVTTAKKPVASGKASKPAAKPQPVKATVKVPAASAAQTGGKPQKAATQSPTPATTLAKAEPVKAAPLQQQTPQAKPVANVASAAEAPRSEAAAKTDATTAAAPATSSTAATQAQGIAPASHTTSTTAASAVPVAPREAPASQPHAVSTYPAAATQPAASASPYREIAVNTVVPNPYQPRRDMDAEQIAELANSIASEGLLQPIVVRPLDGGKGFELIAGERRWRAHQKLGLKTIAARVINASDSSSAVISLIENIQRQALNPIDEALGFASLMRDFDLTQEAVSERIGRARASIANSLRLLALDREIQGYISKGILSVGHAKILLGLEEPAQRLLIARRVIEGGISVRETENLVRRLKNEKAHRPAGAVHTPVEADRTAIADLEKQLSSKLNTKVQLRHTPKKGRIVIEYYGNEDLQRILERTGLQL